MNQAVQEPAVVEMADEIDLRSLWETFSPWKWRILFLSLLAVALSLIVAKGITPLFPATTTLMVEAGQARPLKIEDVYGLETSGSEYFETQFAVVRSREIAKRVVRKLNLANDEFFYSEKPGLVKKVRLLLPLPPQPERLLAEEEKIDLATDKLVDSLSVEPVRKTQLVNISIEHPNAKTAAAITDAIANEYVESQMEIQLNVARNAAEWLGSRLTDLKQNLSRSEGELQQFLEANNLVDLQGVQTVPAEELKALNQQVSESRGKLNELSRRYGERHPQLLATREELASLERSYAAKLREIQSIGRKEAQLRQLQRNVQVNRQLYDTFLQRAGETSQSNKWESPMARIVDRGVPALEPSKPRIPLIAAATFILTFLFATALVFVAAAIDRGIKTPQQLRDLGIAPLGALPFLRKSFWKRSVNPYDATVNLKDRGFAEAVKTLRTNLILDGMVRKQKVIAVTSTVPGEGKTTVAACLARSLSELEKVLLIDADLRRPAVHRALGVNQGKAGLAQLIAGNTKLEEVFVRVAENLHLLRTGPIPPDPSELLSSERFSRLLEFLGDRYDRIIIDTPPVAAVSDALVVGRLSSGVVYVVHADKTAEEMVSYSVRRLRERGSTVLGAVLNQVTEDLLKEHQYYYGYYGRYAGYNTPDN